MEIRRRLEGRNPDCIPFFRDEAEPELTRGERISLTVIFTGFDATLAALQRAGELAGKLNPLIRVLVPQIVSYSLPLEHPAVDPEFRARQFLKKCENQAGDVFIDVRLGRDRQACLEASLEPRSIVLIGESRRHWWRTPEQRLAGRLRAGGHHVILVRQ